jgi:hypothetical protein
VVGLAAPESRFSLVLLRFAFTVVAPPPSLA